VLKRAETRDLVRKKLTNKTGAGDRVYDSLPFPTANEDCPCILIYTPQDNAQSSARHASMFSATLSISIEVRVSEKFTTSAATLDRVCEEIEDILLGDQDFLDLFESIASVNTQCAYEDGGELPLSIAIITITGEYKRVIQPRPDGHFLTAQITVDAVDPRDPNVLGDGPDGRAEGVAVLNISQS